MSIYISGMELPTVELGAIPVIIFADGCVENFFSHEKIGKAMPVPEHGDLIERDTLSKRIKEETINQAEFYADRWHPVVLAYGDCYGKVQNAPTIIPADIKTMYYPQVDGITPTVIKPKKEETE